MGLIKMFPGDIVTLPGVLKFSYGQIPITGTFLKLEVRNGKPEVGSGKRKAKSIKRIKEQQF
jgi:hypothetical protein